MSRWSTPGEAHAYETGYIEGMAEGKRWIPVTEKLPEYYEPVLITAWTNTLLVAEFRGDLWEEENCYLDLDEVKAWMPLPKPYEYPPIDFMNKPEEQNE